MQMQMHRVQLMLHNTVWQFVFMWHYLEIHSNLIACVCERLQCLCSTCNCNLDELHLIHDHCHFYIITIILHVGSSDLHFWENVIKIIIFEWIYRNEYFKCRRSVKFKWCNSSGGIWNMGKKRKGEGGKDREREKKERGREMEIARDRDRESEKGWKIAGERAR